MSRTMTPRNGRAGTGRYLEGFFVFILFAAYWIIARRLEAINLLANPPAWWLPFTQMQPLVASALTFIVEMLHPRVLRHLIPIFVGWQLARNAATGMVQLFYKLPDTATAASFAASLRQNQTPRFSFGRGLPIRREKLAEDRNLYPLLRVGGPGKINISESDVVVTEKNGRFHRVLGPGTRHLERFEVVYRVLDLLQQERTAEDVRLTTRDGIEIRTSLSIIFRIRRSDNPEDDNRPTSDNPFPFGDDAVRRAAYTETVQKDGFVTTWEDVPLNIVRGALREEVGKLRLDELIYPELTFPDQTEHQPHQTLRKATRVKAADRLKNVGIELLEVKLGRLETHKIVTNQRIEYWRAYWRKQARISAADGQAKAVTDLALARAEAEAAMIQAIVEGLETARRESGSADRVRELVALRLIESLEKIARQPDLLPAPDAQLRLMQQTLQGIHGELSARQLEQPGGRSPLPPLTNTGEFS